MSYCASRFTTIRRRSTEVLVGSVGVGGAHPIRVQSMTTSDTQDVAATIRQSIALAEVGCEIVRITAPNVAAAKCLQAIRTGLSAAGFAQVPLVADIHFLPAAALEAVEHVEKVRINPGNYADKKKFAQREYSDSDYDRELERLHAAFSPLVKRAKELGRALRIGTNHGSLSDRIMNRYGDTPLGMVESALEFLRIAEDHDYHQIVLSMKASNPKVMIQAYRLLVQRMAEENMHYPLHLGVTEAGDGEDGRIKSAIGIGSLLLDGLGDTIRVSLTEDSVYEIPVAQALARKAMARWSAADAPLPPGPRERLDPFHYHRREVVSIALGQGCAVGPEQPPRVAVRAGSVSEIARLSRELAQPRLRETPAEGLIVPVRSAAELAEIPQDVGSSAPWQFLALDVAAAVQPGELAPWLVRSPWPTVVIRTELSTGPVDLRPWLDLVNRGGRHTLAIATVPDALRAWGAQLAEWDDERYVVTLADAPLGTVHAVGAYRQLAAELGALGSRTPLWIRNHAATSLGGETSFLSRLLDAAIVSGTLLCDGLGDLISIELETDLSKAVQLSYNVLQGAGARISKTEFVACPSCGRTLFDLQTTTQRIRAQTGHLKGVKIAIMGCIVNGPGEMADADFGYVGGAPGKINLYVGKTCVQYNIPQAEADERLIALIRAHGKWQDPQPAAGAA